MKTLIQLLDPYDNELGLFEVDRDEKTSIQDLITEYNENPLDLSYIPLEEFLRERGYNRVFVEIEYSDEFPDF